MTLAAAGCGEQSSQTTEGTAPGSTITPNTAEQTSGAGGAIGRTDSGSDDSREDIAREFLFAFFTGDDVQMQALSIDHPDIQYLWKNPPPGTDRLRDSLRTMEFAEAKPGDVLPDGTTAGPEVSQADVCILLPQQIGFQMWDVKLKRVEGAWLVDPQPFIAPLKREHEFRETQAAANAKSAAEDRIRDALQSLVDCTGQSRECFVNIEAQERYVSFARGAGRSLLLSVQHFDMTEDQAARAEALLNELGDVAKAQLTFTVPLDPDVDRATEITLEVFREIFMIEGDLQQLIFEG